jgi:hypothetical protein
MGIIALICIGIVIAILIIFCWMLYKQYFSNIGTAGGDAPLEPMTGKSPDEDCGCDGKSGDQSGGLSSDCFIGKKMGELEDRTMKTLKDRVKRNHINTAPLLADNNILGSDGANSNALHDTLVPPMQLKYDPNEWKEQTTQNENKATMLRRRDFFPKKFKRPPMKTIDNIKILGYRPGPKEIGEYWCSGNVNGR